MQGEMKKQNSKLKNISKVKKISNSNSMIINKHNFIKRNLSNKEE